MATRTSRISNANEFPPKSKNERRDSVAGDSQNATELPPEQRSSTRVRAVKGGLKKRATRVRSGRTSEGQRVPAEVSEEESRNNYGKDVTALFTRSICNLPITVRETGINLI